MPPSPDPVLTAVNAAQTIMEMREAITDPLLGLDLTAFNALATPQQDEVLQRLIDNRPVFGYLTVSSVQDALNNEINQVVVDPNNIYVRAGSIGGDGSRAHPFGTISQGITAVNVGGTVHILEGTYPLTAQIDVNKVGITLLGENNPMLLLQAAVIPLLISANNVTVNGLTITSDVPYVGEFIQVGETMSVLLTIQSLVHHNHYLCQDGLLTEQWFLKTQFQTFCYKAILSIH